jgi:hypothetical protein
MAPYSSLGGAAAPSPRLYRDQAFGYVLGQQVGDGGHGKLLHGRWRETADFGPLV